jgi:hypothetical protein
MNRMNLNAMKQTAIIACLLIGISISGIAQNKNTILHSNKGVIMCFHDNSSVEWIIAPSVKPDVLTIYDVTAKVKKVKFVSDIDSIEFIAKVNKPIDFIVLYKEDTAQTRINFTNQIPNTISMENKLLSLSMFWSEAKYNFAFYDQLTFDWDSLYRAYIPLMMKTANDVEYNTLMRKFVGSLQDGHTNFNSVNDIAYKDFIPMVVTYFHDTLTITVIDSLLLNTYPLGSKILKINGMQADEYMDKFVNPYVHSRFKPTQQGLAAEKLLSASKLDDKITLTYLTPQGEIRTNTPPRNGSKNRLNPQISRKDNDNMKLMDVSWIDNTNIAVLTINSFNNLRIDIIKMFNNIKDTLYHADGIIIDIRKNGGGVTEVAKYLIKHIIKDPYFLGLSAETRIHNAGNKAQGNFITEWEDFYKMKAYEQTPAIPNYIEDSIKRFDCPIVILFSSFTFSAAEDFLIMLAEHPNRPLFIGQPSYGSTGAPLVIRDWPIDGSFVRICSRRMRFPYSQKPFIEGIIPDIWVKYSFEEYMSGVDKDINVAVQELEKQIKENKAKE